MRAFFKDKGLPTRRTPPLRPVRRVPVAPEDFCPRARRLAFSPSDSKSVLADAVGRNRDPIGFVRPQQLRRRAHTRSTFPNPDRRHHLLRGTNSPCTGLLLRSESEPRLTGTLRRVSEPHVVGTNGADSQHGFERIRRLDVMRGSAVSLFAAIVGTELAAIAGGEMPHRGNSQHGDGDQQVEEINWFSV